jgi:hypothetical protein
MTGVSIETQKKTPNILACSKICLEGLEEVEGNISVFAKTTKLERVDLTETATEGNVAVFAKLPRFETRATHTTITRNTTRTQLP